jgi:sec-independent protein translocase protein TatA
MNIASIYAIFGNLGGPEIFLIVLFILIFFGAKKIPELARGLGKGIREFKDATREIKDEIEDGANSVNDNHRKIAK